MTGPASASPGQALPVQTLIRTSDQCAALGA